jgi:hypothetical protein
MRIRFGMSRLSTRIMVIMLVPLLLFFVGLFSIDQYRTTLIGQNSQLLNGRASLLPGHWRWLRLSGTSEPCGDAFRQRR